MQKKLIIRTNKMIGLRFGRLVVTEEAPFVGKNQNFKPKDIDYKD